MRNVINIAARVLTSGLAIWTGLRLIMLGLVMMSMGVGWIGAVTIAMAFIFFVPAFLALFGGSLKVIRGLWVMTALLSLVAIFYPPARAGGIAFLIYALIGLAISFGARDRKVEEEEDVSAFS